MPTTPARRAFIGSAIECFLAQTWPDKELVILNDGGEPLHYEPPQVRVINADGKATIGSKRNQLCEMAQGEIICHWDDDDWSAPGRIAEQVEMLERSKKAVAGYYTILSWDGSKPYLYKGCTLYAWGSSLMYRKEWWAGHRFPEIQVGEDNKFVAIAQRSMQLYSMDGSSMMVSRVHPGNTSVKVLGDSNCPEVPIERLPAGFVDAPEYYLQPQ